MPAKLVHIRFSIAVKRTEFLRHLINSINLLAFLRVDIHITQLLISHDERYSIYHSFSVCYGIAVNCQPTFTDKTVSLMIFISVLNLSREKL